MLYSKVVNPTEGREERRQRKLRERDLALRVKLEGLALFGPGRESYPGRVEHFRGTCTECNRQKALLWQPMRSTTRPNGAGHVVYFRDPLCVECVATLFVKGTLWVH